jgi:hypothetical protein
MSRSTTHRWADAIRYDPHSTTRTCVRCGMLKITRHEPGNFPPHWVEFERDGFKIGGASTPVCVEGAQPVSEAAE